ncbi:hypothetical protein Anas_14215, partial [Armadillidium nasatum]
MILKGWYTSYKTFEMHGQNYELSYQALTTWLALGGLFYRKPTKMLPFSADECNPLNMTSMSMNMTSLNMNMTSLNNNTFGKLNSFTNGSIEDAGTESFFVQLYQISYTLNAVIGSVTCVVLAAIVSWITDSVILGNDIQSLDLVLFIRSCDL